MTVVEHLPQGARVCLIRLRSLGDCVLTTPAISLMHEYRPDLRIGVVVESRFAAVFEDNPAISELIAPEPMAVRRSKPDLCVNFHGGTRSQWMTAISGARWRAGFAHHSVTFAYNLKIPRAQRILGVNRVVHTAEHLASAMFALGIPRRDIPAAALFANESPRSGRYAVLHPFASAPNKRWAPERFCEVARYLQLWNIEPVFLAGPDDDALPFSAHAVLRGTLTDVKAMLSKAALFIGNDSGPAHMAAAFAVSSVVLFGGSNPIIWGPWRTASEVIVAPNGLSEVSVSRVIAALDRLRTLKEAHA
ncbi:MAG TPA: glycosyltransferase family 9 protein [Bryobacteraceae bacterium]|jgi:ADP-heptose:LPS heptosyltransferase|nr:glycosyltransferase family 9 protein [Bryobacteraceae bacterium]